MKKEKFKPLITFFIAAFMFIGRYIKNGNAQATHAISAAKDFVATYEADK